MDIFVEQIIRKKFGPKDYMSFFAVFLVGTIIMYAAMVFIPHLSFFLLIAICISAYYIITSRNVEFEYSITNGNIAIDKIINRRKRKHIISVDARNIEDIGKYNPEEHRNKNYNKQIFASINDNGNDSWYICLRDSEKGNLLVVFDPEQKVLDAIKPFVSRRVSKDVFSRN